MDAETKAREVRLRGYASRRGLRLERSRRRDPRSLGFGTYRLVDLSSGEISAGGEWFGLTLDDVEQYLNQH